MRYLIAVSNNGRRPQCLRIHLLRAYFQDLALCDQSPALCAHALTRLPSNGAQGSMLSVSRSQVMFALELFFHLRPLRVTRLIARSIAGANTSQVRIRRKSSRPNERVHIPPQALIGRAAPRRLDTTQPYWIFCAIPATKLFKSCSP